MSHYNTAPSSATTKHASVPSPTQPPPYRTAAPVSPVAYEPSASVNASTHARPSAKRQRNATKAQHRPPADEEVEDGPPSLQKRPRKKAVVELPRSAQKHDTQPRPGSSTVIRARASGDQCQTGVRVRGRTLPRQYRSSAKEDLPEAAFVGGSSASKTSPPGGQL